MKYFEVLLARAPGLYPSHISNADSQARKIYKQIEEGVEKAMNNRVEHVKSFFAQPEQYLHGKGDFNIRIRAEVVKSFIGNNKFESILDIGCGSGAISLPLLQQDVQLTLLDVSSNMLTIARSHIPSEFSGNVKTINADFMGAELQFQSYDLILCLGVLAHIDSPMNVIAKMISLLKPNGSIIVQNTDSQHPVRYLFDLYSSLRHILLQTRYTLNRRQYTLNLNAGPKIMKMFSRYGLKLSAIYRYTDYVPGMARLFTDDSIYNDKMYKFIGRFYGTYTNNYLGWLGINCIYHFTKFDNSDIF